VTRNEWTLGADAAGVLSRKRCLMIMISSQVLSLAHVSPKLLSISVTSGRSIMIKKTHWEVEPRRPIISDSIIKEQKLHPSKNISIGS
jgi:hypothetical protein